MRSTRWLWAFGLALSTCLGAGSNVASAQDSEIRDRAGMFSPQAIEDALATLSEQPIQVRYLPSPGEREA